MVDYPAKTLMPAPLPNAKAKTLLGVPYDHYKLPDGSDLYITRHGRPFLQHLRPESWFESEWFRNSREKLRGTSTVYKVRTKPIDGVAKDLVVKWCRVGEKVPMDTFTLNKFIDAEFNTPYEEFSLVMEMRARHARHHPHPQAPCHLCAGQTPRTVANRTLPHKNRA